MILGVNAPPTGWHDAAACLVDSDGTLLAFCEEERLSRHKHARREGPRAAVRYCLAQAGAQLGDADLVAIGWDVPLAGRLYGHEWTLEQMPAWLEQYLGWSCSWRDMPELRFVGHHLAHATIAFHASDFDAAAVLVVDGNGDDESISIYSADRERGLVRRRVWPRSHSLGYLYDAACRFVGFDYLQAGKLMGLSAYGRAQDAQPWELLPSGMPESPTGVDDGDGDGFNKYIYAWSAQLDRLAGSRCVGHACHELHLDGLAVQVAVSAQDAIERAVLQLADIARELAGTENLCLAGGVALNCKANGLLRGPVFAPRRRMTRAPRSAPRGMSRRHRAAGAGSRRTSGLRSTPASRASSTACIASRYRWSASAPRCRPAAAERSSRAPVRSDRALSGTARSSPTQATPRCTGA